MGRSRCMAPRHACRYRNYCAEWLYGVECSRLPHGRGSVVNATGRAGDVNPPVTLRARPASAAPGTHEGRYRPIDIDRTPFRIETRRFNGERVLQSIRNTRKSTPLGFRQASRLHRRCSFWRADFEAFQGAVVADEESAIADGRQAVAAVGGRKDFCTLGFAVAGWIGSSANEFSA